MSLCVSRWSRCSMNKEGRIRELEFLAIGKSPKPILWSTPSLEREFLLYGVGSQRIFAIRCGFSENPCYTVWVLRKSLLHSVGSQRIFAIQCGFSENLCYTVRVLREPLLYSVGSQQKILNVHLQHPTAGSSAWNMQSGVGDQLQM